MQSYVHLRPVSVHMCATSVCTRVCNVSAHACAINVHGCAARVCTHVCNVSVHTCAINTHMCNQSVHVCNVCTCMCDQCTWMCSQCVHMCAVCVCMCNVHTRATSVSHTCAVCATSVCTCVCNASVHACAINIHTCAVCAIGVCTHVYNLFHTKESMLTPLPHLMYWKLFHCSTRRASSLFEMGKWQPTPVLVPRKSHGWRSLVQATVHGVAKSRTRLGDFTKLTKYILLFDCPMFTEAAHGRGLDYRH